MDSPKDSSRAKYGQLIKLNFFLNLKIIIKFLKVSFRSYPLGYYPLPLDKKKVFMVENDLDST